MYSYKSFFCIILATGKDRMKNLRMNWIHHNRLTYSYILLVLTVGPNLYKLLLLSYFMQKAVWPRYFWFNLDLDDNRFLKLP